ncbi:MAG: SDR family NAD(P)-dependent oxidoreductase, partial [Candidatus Sericytochromatia bacterium]
ACQSIPYFAVYAATKAYVLSFSEAIAEEVAPHGVKVSCLCPGPTRSEFIDQADFKTDMIHKAPLMEAEEVASIGLAALRGGKPVVVAGLLNALGAAAPRFFPRSLVSKISGGIFKPNKK